jgi:hypothetical protein
MLPLTFATSMAFGVADAKYAAAAWMSRGISRSLASRFIVPSGRMPRALPVPIRWRAAVRMVPSPPPTTSTSMSLRAALATASSMASGGNSSTVILWPCAVNASSTACRIVSGDPSIAVPARRLMIACTDHDARAALAASVEAAETRVSVVTFAVRLRAGYIECPRHEIVSCRAATRAPRRSAIPSGVSAS